MNKWKLRRFFNAISEKTDSFFIYSNILIFFLYFQLIIKKINYQFGGEDWYTIIAGCLERFGFFNGDFSILGGLSLYNLLNYSYGWLFYLIECFRLFLFKFGIVNFTEENYRLVFSFLSFVFTIILVLALRDFLNHKQRFIFLLLFIFVPMHLSYLRGWGLLSFGYLIRLLPLIYALRYLKSQKTKDLLGFYIFQFILFSNDSSYVYWGASILLIMICLFRSVNFRPGKFLKIIKQDFFANSVKKTLFIIFATLNGFIVFFNFIFFRKLISQGYKFQGVLAHVLPLALKNESLGLRADYWSLFEKFYNNVGPVFCVLLGLTFAWCIFKIINKKKFSDLSIFSIIVILAYFVPIILLSYRNYPIKIIYFIFPLILLIADNLADVLNVLDMKRTWLKYLIVPVLIIASVWVSLSVVNGTSKNDYGYGVYRDDNGYRALGYIFRKNLSKLDTRDFYVSHEMKLTFNYYLGEKLPILTTQNNRGTKVDLYIVDLSKEIDISQIDTIVKSHNLQEFFTITNGSKRLFIVYANHEIIDNIALSSSLEAVDYAKFFNREYSDFDLLFNKRFDL